MQPYQEASNEIKRQQSEPLKIAKNIGSAVVGVLGGAALISKIAPFLSNYVPQDLAMKGLSKISPKMAGFISSSMAQGHSFDDIKEFLGKKIQKEQNLESPKENGNIIQQYSPELYQFLNDHIQKGRSPLEAGALAELQNNFKNIIKKMAVDHKAPFSSILQTVFGQDKAQTAPSQPSEQIAPQAGQQPSGGMQALMDAIQTIQQRRSGGR